ncbi:hydantoinase/oxoprolinase family protein [Marinimicrobium alkaliphilum]|uniref:hydantoinase/oxoprolinase family protein n=1 Tax=Marinimicrobium alkaliphilum TaxID=2202654 RepID=UPI000DBA6C4F|nr:hydantoinase/oxoprolinase family protein [Marinimicrobium alkaliphilum]
MMLLGVDTGGTFTDFVLYDAGRLRIHKVLSSPDAPERAILQGIDDLGLDQAIADGQLVVIHGSTVATNAALEGKGVRTLLITNAGLTDMLSIGRQTRAELYQLLPGPQPIPVPRDDCLGVDCRVDAEGKVLTALTQEEIDRVAARVREKAPEAVAINLLFSFLNDADEKALAEAMPEGVFTSRSSFVLPEYKEYERGIATWLNAYLGPRVQGYLSRLQSGISPAPLGVMQSSGGTIDAEQAGQRAVNLLLSGPAGGLAAAHFIGQLLGPDEKLLTFDMGGTSTDVALIDGELKLTNEGRLGPWPVAVPMVDMHTIGAGGGSLAQVDAGGLLQVGPQSAGASPGPACYGKGGAQATVTDANAVLGRLHPDYFLGGAMSLDLDAAQSAVDAIAQGLGIDRERAALGIVELANEHMVRALRVISVQRGYDPTDFRLCCFGGAGGLHVCALAEALGMNKALVPIHGGVLSALGMLVAPRERQLSRTLQQPLAALDSEQLERELAALAADGRAQLEREGVEPDAIHANPSLDLRYQGQTYTLNVPYTTLAAATEAFHEAHRQRYGHRLDMAVELVNVRQQVLAPSAALTLPSGDEGSAPVPLEIRELPAIGACPVYQRDQLPSGALVTGPALVCETVSTTLIGVGWSAEVDGFGNLLLSGLGASGVGLRPAG